MKINVLTGKPNTGIYQDRCTGKSTGLALKYLSEAILNPGTKVSIVDHYGIRDLDLYLMKSMQVMVGLLGLEHLEFNRSFGTVEFKLYQESDEYIEVNGKLYKEVSNV